MKLFSVMFAMAFALVACDDDSGDKTDPNAANRVIVEEQIAKDFKDEGTINVSAVNVERGYQVATFTITPVAAGSIDTLATTTRNMTAWYEITDAKATIKMDAENLGIAMPAGLKAEFDATPKYSVVADWRVTEVELDTKYINSVTTQVYEIELDNIANTNLEAELYYSFDAPIKLLYSKETLDDDDDSDDKVVIDQKLIDAVASLYPSPAVVKVIDAEMDGTQVEVEAVVTETGKTEEVEVVFTDTTYTTVASQEIETKTTYGEITPELKDIVTIWFADNVKKVPNAPNDADIATVTTITTNTPTVGVVTYEVEIEYIGTDTKNYEVELTLDKDFAITDQDVEINDVEVTFP